MNGKKPKNWNHVDLEHELMTWKSEERATKLQKKWAEEDASQISLAEPSQIRLVAGLDVSFPKNSNTDWGGCCACSWNVKTKEIEENAYYKDTMPVEYIPGYLGFREVPLMVRALVQLDRVPDVILTDGHGLLHPQRFGEAVHLGTIVRIPTIGVAKNPFYGKLKTPLEKFDRKPGTTISILAEKDNGKDIIGYGLCTLKGSKPIYLSVGKGISLKSALEIVKMCTTGHKIPEPIYLADKLSRKKVSKTTMLT